ncbi:sensor histidine kinase [Paraburkholderia sp. A1RO-5L]|uniref:sensor histidine kinase n=1 Tax=unclassified Paraburkholderia TaxID=2615204 RepID=UPI003B77FD9A
MPALEWLVDDFRQHSHLRVELRCDASEIVFNDAASTALFRIVQEGLTNIARHAGAATEVHIDFRCNASMCDLLIQDNGAPIASGDSRPAGATPSSGLASVRDRVRRLQGTAVIGPRPDRGFQIRLSIPRSTIEQLTTDSSGNA